MIRYEFTVKEIENGWLVMFDLPDKPLVTHYFDDELKAQVAVRNALNKMIELTAKEEGNGRKTN